MKKVFRSAALLLLCTTVYAQDITQTMSMNLQNVTLKEFFKNLEAQTSFSVVYRDVILSEDADVVVSASNRQLKDILSQVLEKYGLSYKVSNKTIVIVKAEAQAPVKNQKAKKITGVITDETGFPVAGANIVVKERPTVPSRTWMVTSLWRLLRGKCWKSPISVSCQWR